MASISSSGDNLYLSLDEYVHVIRLGDTAEIAQTEHVTETSKQLPIIKKLRQDGENEDQNKGPCQILCSATSSNLLAVGTSLKTVLIFNTSPFQLRRAFRIPKAPNAIAFDRAGSHLVIGDRAGHVCRYSVEAPSSTGYKDITGEMCGFEGEALTGAISMVLDVNFSSDGKYLLIADRDEKIRVSRYDHAYVIEAFCLGHTEYVASICVDVVNDRVFSTGGDSVVIEWDISSGKKLTESTKIGDKPLKKIVAIQSDANLLLATFANDDKVLNVLKADKGEISLLRSITVADGIMDICLLEGHVCGVHRSGLFSVDVNSGAVREFDLGSDFKERLVKIKDPIGNYFKNITHQNMEDYKKRKEDKMLKDKEKKLRKRKQNNSNSEEPKKISV